jgi:hypothetical protein
MTTNEQDNLQAVLSQALYLEPGDLEANRNGQLTAAQIERIRGQLQAARIQLGCLISVPALLVLGLILLVSSGELWFILLGLAVILFGVWRTLRPVVKYDRQLRQEIDKGEVAVVTGPLQKEQRGRAGNYVGTQDKFFPAPQTVFDALSRDIPVAIYHLPESNQMLSMEVLEGGMMPDARVSLGNEETEEE